MRTTPESSAPLTARPPGLFVWDGNSVHTDQTVISGGSAAHGWLAYDAGCRFCVRWIERVRPMLARRGIGVTPLATPWVRGRLGLGEGRAADRMWLLLSDGRQLGGADAAIELARRIAWARPLAWLAGLPGMRRLAHAAYDGIARRRLCLGGACEAPPVRALAVPPSVPDEWADARKPAPCPVMLFDALPLLVLPVVAAIIGSTVPAWAFMWLLAMAIFAGFKWLTFRRAQRHLAARCASSIGWRRCVAYFFAWPGMAAVEFLNATRPDTRPAQPSRIEWCSAAAKLTLGLLLFTVAAPPLLDEHPFLAGWVGMLGAIFALHFGLFHLLSCVWRQMGVDARPMMRMPIAAAGVADFWGRRWNRDFRVLSHEFAFAPLSPRIGATAAMWIVFLLSGLIHDAVISWPAGGGYGLPTAYFLIQAAGLSIERSAWGRRLGLGRGLHGWLFALLVAAGPIGLLFHTPFVLNIFVPFMRAM